LRRYTQSSQLKDLRLRWIFLSNAISMGSIAMRSLLDIEKEKGVRSLALLSD